jgi:hypothetical protein
MIKIITWITKIIITVITALFFSSCHIDYNTIKGSGTITTENRTISEKFTGIDVSSAIEVTVEQADKVEVIVEADDNLLNTIKTEVKNGKLVISNESYVTIRNGTRRVTVKMPIIEDLEASSASSITNKNTLKGNQIFIKSSSAGSIKLDLEMDAITCKSSSGSSIELKGLAMQLDTQASSGSTTKCFKLLANSIVADASSGSSIDVHPIVSLKAEASSGASIEYNSVPKNLQKKSSSGGSVEQD